jgi:hypothetical protein
VTELSVDIKVSSVKALVCWDPYTLKKKHCIINDVNFRLIWTSKVFKRWFWNPLINSKSFWSDAMDFEIYTVDLAFQVLEANFKLRVGY